MSNSTVGMPKDDMMGFVVFKPESKPIKLTRKEIYFTLTASGSRFSMKAIETMGKPEAVLVMFDARDRMLVIPSKLSEPNSIYLAWPGAGKNYKNLLKPNALNTEILHRMKGGEFENFRGLIRCSGKVVKRIDCNALIFDLTEIHWERKNEV